MAEVLLIDDMRLVRGALKTILTRAGHAVTEAAGGHDGIALLRKQRFDVVVTDMIMPDHDGPDVMTFIHGMSNRPAILAISGGSAHLAADEALRLAREQADVAMRKPFDNAELVGAVESLVRSPRP